MQHERTVINGCYDGKHVALCVLTQTRRREASFEQHKDYNDIGREIQIMSDNLG